MTYKITQIIKSEPVEGKFGYIGFSDAETPEQALETYRAIADLARLPKYGQGMDKKKYDEIMDLMITRKPIQIDPGELEEMNSVQRYGFDTARKSIGRIDYKNR